MCNIILLLAILKEWPLKFFLTEFTIKYILQLGTFCTFCSGFFNGANFFNKSDGGSLAAGAMFMIMGFLWFLGAPLAVILVVLVRNRKLQRSLCDFLACGLFGGTTFV